MQIASFAAVDHSLQNSKLRGKIIVFSLQFHGPHYASHSHYTDQKFRVNKSIRNCFLTLSYLRCTPNTIQDIISQLRYVNNIFSSSFCFRERKIPLSLRCLSMLENICLCTIKHDVHDCISHVFDCVFGTAQIYWSHIPKLSHNLASCRIIFKHKNAVCNGGKIIT